MVKEKKTKTKPKATAPKSKAKAAIKEAKPKKKEVKKKGTFLLEVETAGEEFAIETDNIGEAIIALELHHTNTKTIIRARLNKKGSKWMEPKVLMVAHARRIFNNSAAADAFGVNIARALGVNEV